jgi:nucleoside-diphosphate-sugar epimerase
VANRSGEFLTEAMAHMPGADPESLYGWIKLLGEVACQAAVQQHSADIKIVRMFNVYGPGEHSTLANAHVIPALVMKAVADESGFLHVWGDGQQERSFLFTDDAVNGILTVFENGVAGVPYNLGQPNKISIADLATKIVALTGCNKRLLYESEKPTGVATRMPDISKAMSLGWAPRVSMDKGLEITIKWIREQLC